jgi:hypothetical protein
LSSSFLPVRDVSVKAAPDSRYVATEIVQLRTLNNVFFRLVPAGASVLLKIDAQGLEKQILDGSRGILNHVSLIHLEVLLCSLYEGDSTIGEMINYLDFLRFDPVSVEPGFADMKTGRQFQVDILFRARQAPDPVREEMN